VEFHQLLQLAENNACNWLETSALMNWKERQKLHFVVQLLQALMYVNNS